MNVKIVSLTSALALAAGAGVAQDMNFNRIAAFPVVRNMAEGQDQTRETSPEIIAATADGMTLVYTDSPLGVLGLIDITDPAQPAPLGNIPLNGEPTSVVVVGNRAYVGVNTSESYTDPSGRLAVIDLDSKTEVASCDLGGQPDSIAADKDGSFISVAIENERDEDLGDGRTGSDACRLSGDGRSGRQHSTMRHDQDRQFDRPGPGVARRSGTGIRRHQRQWRNRGDIAGKQPPGGRGPRWNDPVRILGRRG